MTSDEIRNQELPRSNNIEFHYILEWLREIAYQLAVMNERNAKYDDWYETGDPSIHSRVAKLEDSLGSSVPAGSGSAVRGGIEGFEPPVGPVGSFENHPFRLVLGNRFCGRCGAGEHHAIHTAAALPTE